MNSSSKIDMNTVNVEAVADDILVLANDFAKIFDTLDSLNKTINSQYCWQGKSADYYQKKYNDFSENFQNISKGISSNSNFLKATIEKYRQIQNSFLSLK